MAMKSMLDEKAKRLNKNCSWAGVHYLPPSEYSRDRFFVALFAENIKQPIWPQYGRYLTTLPEGHLLEIFDSLFNENKRGHETHCFRVVPDDWHRVYTPMFVDNLDTAKGITYGILDSYHSLINASDDDGKVSYKNRVKYTRYLRSYYLEGQHVLEPVFSVELTENEKVLIRSTAEEGNMGLKGDLTQIAAE